MRVLTKITLIFIALISTTTITISQEVWSLQKCIDYAMENNLQIKRQQISTNYSEIELEQSKANRLPNLNAGLSNDYNYGRSLTVNNTYENVNSIGASGYVSSQMLLWNGFRLRNTITMNRLNHLAALEDLEKAKDDISLAITTLYLDILFSHELIESTQSQIEITEKQIERTQNLVDAGSIARGGLLEIESQLANEQLQLVNYQNSLNLAYLNLYQLLELSSEEKFLVEDPTLPEIDASSALARSKDVYEIAVNNRPEVASAQYRVEAAKEQIKIAKSGYYPSLSLSGSYNTNYNDKYRDLEGTVPFNEQLSNNQRYGFGLNLNIPIFNKFQTKNNVKRAELQVIDRKIQLESTKNVLRKDIEQSYTNALAALNKYIASKKAVNALKESFRYTEERYNVGLISSLDYNQAKTNLNKAESDLLQSKYSYIFRTKILDFYNGIPIRL